MNDCEITHARVRSHGPKMTGQSGTERHMASRRAGDGSKRRAQHASDDDFEMLDHQVRVLSVKPVHSAFNR